LVYSKETSAELVKAPGILMLVVIQVVAYLIQTEITIKGEP